jgi:hypothetical protein
MLSLIQIALTPSFVMRPPKGLAVTLARPRFLRHLFRLTCKKGQGEQIASGRRKTSVREMDAYAPSIKIPCSSKKIP